MQQPLDAFQVTANDFGLERQSSVEGGTTGFAGVDRLLCSSLVLSCILYV